MSDIINPVVYVHKDHVQWSGWSLRAEKRMGISLRDYNRYDKIRRLDTRIVAVTAVTCFVLLILLTIVSSIISGQKVSGSEPDSGEPESEHLMEQAARSKDEKDIVAVIEEVNTEQEVMTLVDAVSDARVKVYYNGGTDIRDKYGKVIAGTQLNAGDMAEVTYNGVTSKLLRLTVNTEGWETKVVSGLLVNTQKKRLSFLGTRYLYSDTLLILSNGEKIELSDLVKSDVLTIRGYNEKICSIIVTRGHGYLKLVDEDAFLGGSIDVGMLLSRKIDSGMVITVPEGEYSINVDNLNYSGKKKVKIARDKVTVLNVGEYGPTAVQKGRVTFKILPKGALLTVDGIPTFTTEPAELAYGTHEIQASLGGYHTYKGVLTVDRTETTVTITLSENVNGNEEEDDTGAGDGSMEIDPGIPDLGDEFDDNSTDNEDNSTDGEDNSTEDSDWDDPDDNNTEPDEDNEEDSSNEEDTWEEEDTNSGSSQPGRKVDNDHTLTIRCSSGAEVYINGSYVGDIKNGEIVLPKYLGLIDIDLMLNDNAVKSYSLEVLDDKENTIYTFPKF